MFWIILIAGFIVRSGFVYVLKPYKDLARYELERAAISLAESGTLGNPYAIPTGPSAHIAPVYAFMMAAIFWLFGTGALGEIIKVSVSTLISVVPYALFPKLSESLGYGAKLGLWTGLIASLVPLKPGSDLLGDWEAPLAATFLLLSMTGVAGVWRQKKLAASNAVRQGLYWGLAVLTAPAFLSIYLGTVFVGFFLLFRSFLKQYVRFAVIQTFCIGCLLTPWIVRNYVQLGSPVVTRSNVGLELRISNNDHAGPNEILNFRSGVYHRYHPLQNPAEAELVRALGEVEYNDRAKAEAMTWIRSHPGRFLSLSIQRMILFWFPDADLGRSVIFGCFSLASFGGVFLLLRRELAAGLVLAIPLLIQPIPHYLVHVNTRHKYPIDWIGFIGLAILAQFAYSLLAARVPLAGLIPIGDVTARRANTSS